MKLRHSFTTAIVGLKTNKSRSALTILGIVIGIMAIMIVVSLGQGAQDLIVGQIQSIGAKTIAIVPGREPKGPTDVLATFADSLKDRDLEALSRKTNVPYAATIMPIVFGTYTASYESETYRPTVYGVNTYFVDLYDISMSSGRPFTEDEVKGYSDVAVIGSKVREELFPNSDPIGKRIKLRGRNFRIIGIMEEKGQLNFLNFDEAVVAPYTTVQRYLAAIKHFNRIIVEADSEEHVDATAEDIIATLRSNHNITDPTKDDFFVQTQADALNTVKTITDVLTLFLAAVAAISLLVGGIGIMNIMLVSVTERTREIGLRKAVGASEKNIMIQFLLEAVLLTGIGGLVGILLGTLFSALTAVALSQFANLSWGFSFPLNAAIIGMLVSSIIGLIFGLYPARQAAQKNPIEALRFE